MNLDRYIKRNDVYTDEYLQSFVDEMCKTIRSNWVVKSFEMNKVISIMEVDYDMEYSEYYPGEPNNWQDTYDPLEDLIFTVLNFGYATAQSKNNFLSNKKTKLDFCKCMEELSKVIEVEQISKSKLVYGGPDVTSCSVLATTFGIQDSLKKIGKETKRMSEVVPNFSNKRFMVMMMLVYRFGYGYGSDISYFENMLKHSKVIRTLKKMYKKRK